MGFTAIAESDTGFQPITPAADPKEALTEKIRFAPLSTGDMAIRAGKAAGVIPEGADPGIPINQELAAYLTSFGGKMAGSFRGAKQLLGLDSGEEAGNEAALRRLSEDKDVGSYATAGGVIGSGFDPVTYLMPFKKAKSVVDLAKMGFVGGAATGYINPVEEGGSRIVNAAENAVVSSIAVPIVGKVANKFAGGKPIPWRTPGEVAPPAVNAKAEGAAVQQTAKDVVNEYTDMVLGGKVNPLKGTPAAPVEAAAPAAQAGSMDMNLAARGAGGAVGAAAGALTADENASPTEVASRALIGGFAGWQLAKLGTKIIGTKTGTVQPSIVNAHSGAEPIQVVGDAAEPLFKQEVSQDTTKKIATLARTFFEENPGLRDPTRLISDDIQRYVAGGAVTSEQLAAHGLDQAQFAGIWRASISDHARSLAHLSHVMRQAEANMTPEQLELFRAAGGIAEDSAYVRPFWKKLTDVWRGLLVTQPVTAIRNIETQVGRVGLDVMQAPLDAWLQKLTGKAQTVKPMDGLEELWSVLGRSNQKEVDNILSAFPKQRDRLFQNYLSDVAAGTDMESKVWRGIETGVQAANILNRSQEFIVRRGIFQTALDHEMRNAGLNLTGIIKRNALGQIPEDAVTKAVEKSLKTTFAEAPEWGTMSRKVIDAVNSVPFANLAIPFPRFMYNAIKFQYEYSPMGVLSYLSPAERKAFADGNVEKVSKAVIGSAMFGAAMMFRNSEYAGEKWYEAVNDKGEVKDLRPFNPFASYLFAADVLKKWKDGNLYKLTGNDIAQGFLSVNMRAGTGLYILDNALGMMSKSADESKLSQKAMEFGGDFLAGFVTPLTTFRDAYDEITQGQSTLKDTRQEPLLGPTKSRLPVVSQSMPDVELPTREGPKVTPHPLLRQVTGLSESGPKNSFEKELDRLGFDRREILPSTGDREIDTKYSKAMGAVLGPSSMDDILGFAVEGQVPTGSYAKLSDSMKGYIIHEALGKVRHEVHTAINEGLPPEKQLKMEIHKQPPRLRYLLEELGVKVK